MPAPGRRTVAGRQGLPLALAVLLASCGWRPAPDGYSPASLRCEPFRGTWAVAADDVGWILPGVRLPADARFAFLSIEPQDGYQFSLVLRRRPADVLAEAETLRLTDPDAYRAWRARLRGEPLDSEMMRGLQRDAGPVVEHQHGFPLTHCRLGWFGSAEGHRIDRGAGGADRIAYVALAKGPGGELLVRHEIRESRGDIGSFFGQPLRWYVHAEDRWHRVAAIPESLWPAPLDVDRLPPAASHESRRWAEFAAREAWASFQSRFRAALPPDVVVTVFRPRQFDPAALALPPGELRIELAGHWPEGQPDPFLPLLRSEPGIDGIVVRQSRLGPRNRPYRLLEFTLRPVDAAKPRGSSE